VTASKRTDCAPAGAADDQYAQYMRTRELLSLQRVPGQRVHRDELLFQTVHQSHELWLKLACAEVDEAARQIEAGQTAAAELLMARACLAVDLVTAQLDMLRHLAPADFQVIRSELGQGSGFESPGWRGVRESSHRLQRAFTALLADRHADLLELYRSGHQSHPLYRLAESLVDWDSRIAAWRSLHYLNAIRVIGHTVGTRGTPVDALRRLIDHRFFPELWDVRTQLSEAGPVGARYGRQGAQ
jgi:tryptophan 2,3-dioxygenase